MFRSPVTRDPNFHWCEGHRPRWSQVLSDRFHLHCNASSPEWPRCFDKDPGFPRLCSCTFSPNQTVCSYGRWSDLILASLERYSAASPKKSFAGLTIERGQARRQDYADFPPRCWAIQANRRWLSRLWVCLDGYQTRDSMKMWISKR